jgi:D-alanine--poly(phosphoribitol) ligase subunit 1
MKIFNVGYHFSLVANKFKNKTAIIIGNKKISFFELEKLSNKIANLFIKKKFKKNQNICIIGKKSFYSFGVIIACLKLGISYTCVDRLSPANRTRKILNTLQSACIISTKNFKIKEIKNINLQKEMFSKKFPETFKNKNYAKINKKTIAYVMITSGSTGYPKGASISHFNLMNFIKWSKIEFNTKVDDVASNLNPLFFDNSIFDIFANLFNGNTICSFHREELINPNQLLKKLIKYKVNIWFSVPSLLVYLLKFKSINAQSFKNVHKIIFGGEGFPKIMLKKLFKLKPLNTELINVYGPTECTCICSTYKVNKNDFKKNEMKRFAPLGKTLVNDFFYYIVDRNFKKITNSKPGELIIGGKNVGIGYYNNQKETSEKFIYNPFNKLHKDKVYKSGDLVYKDNNGYLYFSSRIDNQIKLNGYRIELEEIEQSINKIKGVKECAVCFGRVRKIYKIVAFVVHDNVFNKIIRTLNKDLPKYMIPQLIITKKNLPKNNNGKIDRKLLKINFFD